MAGPSPLSICAMRLPLTSVKLLAANGSADIAMGSLPKESGLSLNRVRLGRGPQQRPKISSLEGLDQIIEGTHARRVIVDIKPQHPVVPEAPHVAHGTFDVQGLDPVAVEKMRTAVQCVVAA